jgi:hypothetical protein
MGNISIPSLLEEREWQQVFSFRWLSREKDYLPFYKKEAYPEETARSNGRKGSVSQRMRVIERMTERSR